jgi:copper chaperone CopZ
MRKTAFFCLALMVLVSAAGFAGDKGEMAEGHTKASIKVTGMTCGGCCSKVETAVAKLDGVVKVKADYEKGVAMVVYEKDKIDLAQIVETINTKTSFKAKAPEEKAS